MAGMCYVCLCAAVVGMWILTGTSLSAGRHVNTSLHHRRRSVSKTRRAAEKETGYTCGDGLCTCRGSRADCYWDVPSGESIYIPKMPRDITFVNLESQRIANLREDGFLNVSSLTRLDLFSVYMYYVNTSSFRDLGNLTALDLTYSDLTCEAMSALFSLPSLETLHLSYVILYECDHLNGSVLRNPSPTLQELEIFEHFFRVIDFACFSHLPGLRRLIISGKVNVTNLQSLRLLTSLVHLDLRFILSITCKDLSDVFSIPSLETLTLHQSTQCRLLENIPFECPNTKLQTLALTGNNIQSYQPVQYQPQLNRSCSVATVNCGPVFSLFPSLTLLDLSGNQIPAIHTAKERPGFFSFFCLPKLKWLYLRRNELTYEDAYTSSFWDRLPSLTVMDLSGQRNRWGVHRYQLCQSPLLKSLKLDYNALHFSDTRSVVPNAFWGCPDLRSLSLTHNDFKLVDETRFQQLFGHLTNLTVLLLRSTRFSYITAGMFVGLESLEELDLSDNNIFHLPEDVFLYAPRLKLLNMSLNQLSVISESAFYLARNRQRLRGVDLSGNPFECTCEIIWFQRWILSKPSLFVDGTSAGYTCYNLINTTVQSFFAVEQPCLLSQEANIIIIATISLFLFIMLPCTGLYRYRWHIRLLVFEARRGRGERMRRFREQNFQYDVFVAYNSEDFPWVRDHLMPELEDLLELKLCLHQRDFLPGGAIVENIMESVETSKKMLMIFSRQFAQSHWCQYELQLCLSHSLDTDDVLIVVLLEDIPARELTPAMMAVMKTVTYIEWGDEPDARESFWRRMGLALHEILPGV